ncbi:MAG: response regulator transcription factor [Planctomycetota bacterium]|jgi:two-component system alkaline phosphatase synthesis response regulator PhoP
MATSKKKILVIEDDVSLRLGLEEALRSEDFLVEVAADGEKGLHLALTSEADLILLDLMLPRMDGFEILRRIREDRLEAPVIILTARGQEEDRIMGFEYGADDYVVKPFSVKELLLRIAAVLRRAGEGVSLIDEIAIGEALVDFKAYQIHRGKENFGLSRKEADMLRLFLDNPNQVITRERFLESVWGYHSYPTTRTIDMHVLKLRQKLEPQPESPRYFHTVHGVGYKYTP